VKNSFGNKIFKSRIGVNGANTWMCWDPGEGESKVINHGWCSHNCFCRKQWRDRGLNQELVEHSLCRVKCRRHGLDDSTPLSFFCDRRSISERPARNFFITYQKGVRLPASSGSSPSGRGSSRPRQATFLICNKKVSILVRESNQKTKKISVGLWN
jgi:hypothetical protein